MMNNDEAARFCAFCRRSRYDVVQARHGDEWGPPWTFAPCDPRAAARAALMLQRIGAREVRHARRARLRLRPEAPLEVVVVTELPARVQFVFRLTDGLEVHGIMYLHDESLQALEEATDGRRAVGRVGGDVIVPT